MDKEQQKLAEELLFSEEVTRSFVKELFFGRFNSNLVFPYPKQKIDEGFLEVVRFFAENEIDPEKIDKEMEIPKRVKDRLIELGVMGMTVPTQYGGKGMSQTEYCKVSEILAARCASTALFVNVHQSIGMRALLLFGTDEQKNKWLPNLASGKVFGAFALTEANAGSDAAAIETLAVYDAERKVYKITGRKQWITNGSIAGVLTVMAKTEDGKISAFLVTPDMPGFKVLNPHLEKVGYRGTWTANLEFLNVEVPEANILGEKGKGLKVALTVLDFGRTTFGATCTGSAKFLLERAVKHAKTRYQFKKPLASFGLVKEKISKVAALVYAMDAATYMTAGLIDKGVEDIMLESTMLKVFASEALWDIVYETMQIYGGRCLFTDIPLERMMRDARLNMIGEGANEVMRVFIAAVGMRSVGLELKESSSLKILGQLLKRFKAPVVMVSSDELKVQAKALSKAVRRFGFSVLRVLARYREGVVDKQFDLNRIAASAMELFTTTAVLSKLEHETDEKNIAVGLFYCESSMLRLHEHLDNLFCLQDEKIEEISDVVTGLSK